MAITINAGPTFVAPAYSIDGSNLTYVLTSTNSDMCSMRYVTDIYGLGNSNFIRMKSSPNIVDGKTTVSINRVVENFVSYDFFGGLEGVTAALNSVRGYIPRFGEETDGTIGCTGSSFSIQPNLAVGPIRWIFNGCLQYNDSYNYLDYLIVDNTSISAKRYLTNGPTAQDVGLDEESYLYYLYQHVSGGTSLAVQLDLQYHSGATATFYVTGYFSPLPFVIMNAVGVGPKNINDAAASGLVLDSVGATFSSDVIDCTVDTYGVTIITTPF